LPARPGSQTAQRGQGEDDADQIYEREQEGKE
jgi:hypothetical protein